MKIGYDSKRLFCNFTGLGNYSRTLLSNLGEFFPGNQYYLYTPKIPESMAGSPFAGGPVYLAHTPATRFKAYWRTFSIKKQLKSDQIEIYHGLSNEIPVNINKTGIKSVVTIHDLIFRIFPETYSAFDRKIYDLKFRYACQHADRIIAISENTKKDITEHYGTDPGKIDVIYQACNPLFYKPKGKLENDLITARYHLPPDYLLSVGSVEPRKNLKSVIESLRCLRKELLIPLVVVGKGGKYRQEMERLVIKYGLGNWVIWIDSLPDNEHLQSLYQNSRALIYPSLYEGFGLPVAEALLCRTPVIAASTSSLKEAGGPSTLYTDPENPEQIAGAIEKILTDNVLIKNMIENGVQYAHEKFSPKAVTSQVMECYAKIL